jgi:xanthine dehydrogenase YagS FAD-binding subunit
MKSGIDQPELLIGLRRISDLSAGIAIASDGACLGALTTLAQIAGHPTLAEHYPASTQAASPQLRNMATFIGTWLQRPRCWYFPSPAFYCWLKGGAECHARTGSNQGHAVFDTGVCRAVHPSDLACALTALDATIDLKSRRGARCLPIAEFLQPPVAERRCETLLDPDEMVIAVRLPPTATLGPSIFLTAMERNEWSFALGSGRGQASAMRGAHRVHRGRPGRGRDDPLVHRNAHDDVARRTLRRRPNDSGSTLGAR